MEILIAEDDPISHNLLRNVLEKLSYKVLVAEDGLKAWEILKENDIRMLITDWMMPRIDGLELCMKVRQAKFKNYVYIIIVTAKSDKGDIIKGLKAGADDYIIKPFDPEELKAKIHSSQRIIQLEDDIRNTYIQLLQSEKMASIGQLAAGIAHEINTPTQYVGDNTHFLQDSFNDINQLLEKYGSLLKAIKAGAETDNLVKEAEAALEEADIDYITEEIPKAIQQSLEGLDRVTHIVRAMKEFSHPGTEEKKANDINKAIKNTITITQNEWRHIADMVTDFDSTMPPVPCLPGEFNQVILNMIMNAAHAIADFVGKNPGKKGTIAVSTRNDDHWAEIRIRDTGSGIPERVRSKIFDPFFTTKEVGRGTGQGLAISRSVVVDKHGGTINFETEMGKGTTFIIRLPIGNEQAQREE